MRKITFLFVMLSFGALLVTGCQGGATAETTEGTGGAGTTGGSAPVASAPGHVGVYHPTMTDEMKKQMDDAKAQTMASIDTLRKTDAAAADKMLKEFEDGMKANDPEKMFAQTSLEIMADNTFKMSTPSGDKTTAATGTYTLEGDKLTMTATMVDGKPATEMDAKPLTATYSAADGTIMMGDAGMGFVFKKS